MTPEKRETLNAKKEQFRSTRESEFKKFTATLASLKTAISATRMTSAGVEHTNADGMNVIYTNIVPKKKAGLYRELLKVCAESADDVLNRTHENPKLFENWQFMDVMTISLQSDCAQLQVLPPSIAGLMGLYQTLSEIERWCSLAPFTFQPDQA